MLSDTIDHHEMDTGRREEGLYFAAGSFAQKASFGLGSFVAGIGLDVIRFPQGASPTGRSTRFTYESRHFRGSTFDGIAVVESLIIRSYPLDKEEHARITQAIHDMKVEGT